MGSWAATNSLSRAALLKYVRVTGSAGVYCELAGACAGSRPSSRPCAGTAQRPSRTYRRERLETPARPRHRRKAQRRCSEPSHQCQTAATTPPPCWQRNPLIRGDSPSNSNWVVYVFSPTLLILTSSRMIASLRSAETPALFTLSCSTNSTPLRILWRQVGKVGIWRTPVCVNPAPAEEVAAVIAA